MGECPAHLVLVATAAQGTRPDHAQGCAACAALLQRVEDVSASRVTAAIADCDDAEAEIAMAEVAEEPNLERLAALLAHFSACRYCRQDVLSGSGALDELAVANTQAGEWTDGGIHAGEEVGDYIIVDRIGRGGMGVVYRAEHKLLQRPAAIKMLLPHLSQHDEVVQRFFAEAKAASSIVHPSIVAIYNFGYHTDGSAYIAMPLLAGESLQDRLRRRRRLGPVEAMSIAHQIAGALAAAHERGIVHRDLKPDNVFLVKDPEVPGGERIKLLDFGVAKLAPDQRPDGLATKTNAIMGTPAYMAPEQCRGAGGVDHRADIYALGCILFRALCGRLPFTGETPGDISAAQIRDAPPRCRSIDRQIPKQVDALVDALLQKSPEQRPHSAREVRRMIDGVLEALPVRRRATPVPELPAAAEPEPGITTLSGSSGQSLSPRARAASVPRMRRRLWPWAAGAVATAAAVVVALLMLRPSPTERYLGTASGFGDYVILGPDCRLESAETGGWLLSCALKIAPPRTESGDGPWTAYVDIKPRPGVTLRDALGCGKLVTLSIGPRQEQHEVTRYVLTACILRENKAHDFKTRVSIGGVVNGASPPAARLRVTVGTPASQLTMGYKQLMSGRSYSLADTYFSDVGRRAEAAYRAGKDNKDALVMLVRAAYYEAYTLYLRLLDCAHTGRVEGKACTADDRRRWYNAAVRVMDDELNLLLRRRDDVPRRWKMLRRRLRNELLLRFSTGKVGRGSDVHTNVQRITRHCTDQAQQAFLFLSLIAVAEGRVRAAAKHLDRMLTNQQTMAQRCFPKDEDKRGDFQESLDQVLVAEVGLCGGNNRPLVRTTVCAVRNEFNLPMTGTKLLSEVCADQPRLPDEPLNRGLRLLVSNLKRRQAGQPWAGGCPQPPPAPKP